MKNFFKADKSGERMFPRFKISSYIIFLIGFFVVSSQFNNVFCQSVWNENQANPIFSATGSGWEDNSVYGATVLYFGGQYYLFYTGVDSFLGKSQIGRALSSDGLLWSRPSNQPVLVTGLIGWDNAGVLFPSVITTGKHNLMMWFTGYSGIPETPSQIGAATSTDNGASWTKSVSNPILTVGNPGEWDDYSILSCSVLKDESIFKMWYVAENSSLHTRQIGQATSSDGISWQKNASNPVFSPSAEGWDSHYVQGVSVIIDGNGFRMAYQGTSSSGDSKIGLAYSFDGLNWTRQQQNPVITSGQNGSWNENDVLYPSLIKETDKYRIWFTGTNNSNIKQLGEASSPDQTQPVPAISTFLLLLLFSIFSLSMLKKY